MLQVRERREPEISSTIRPNKLKNIRKVFIGIHGLIKIKFKKISVGVH
jgi:hypothetical protein